MGIAGATTYLAKGIPKFVLYWRMRVAQELAPFKPNEEVTRLEWLRPKAAIERLTHREEKDLLGRIYSPEAEEMRSLTAWLEKLCTPILRRRAWRRLGSTISAYEAELDARAASGKFPSAGLEPVNLVVRRARDAVENGDLETGWKCFLAAQRIEFLYLDGAELDAEAAAIAEEADKLTAWRKKAVVATLSKTDGDAAKAAPRTDGGMAKAAPEPPTEAATAGPKTDGEAERARRVFRAALLLHEHFHNEAYKDGLRRGSSLRLFLFMALALIALLAHAYAGYLGEVVSIAQNSNSLDDKFHILLSIGTVGLLGAVVSAITDMPGTSGSSRIPELTISFRVMMLRLLMGPASAIGLYFVIRSSFSPSVTHFSN